ncbi:MAG: S41 family peptidase, partial [Gemmatimonadota bacterium]
PLFRDFRSWKRYEGGWAQDLWIFDLDGESARQITDHPRSDRDPMWIGDRIYFVSDRTGTLNLFAHDPETGATDQLTSHDDWDVRWPADDGEGRIVFELGGELRVYHTADGRVDELDIFVPDDLVAKRPRRVDATPYIQDFELSPEGTRALIVARGDVFSVPAEHGATRNLTGTSAAHDKWARWSPDGRRIAYVSDRTGEEEVWLMDARTGEERQLTRGDTMMLYAPRWSPDSERLAFSDKEGRLWVVDADDGDRTLVADEPQGQIYDYVWSPDSRHLAFSMSDPTLFGSSVHIWSDGRLRRVTSELFSEFTPAWDPGGDYLYFLADRQYAPQIGSFEWNYVVDRETYVYAMALRSDVSDPFPPRIDQVAIEGEEDEAEVQAEGEEAAEAGRVVIEFDGLADRVTRVPVDAENWGSLATTRDGDLLLVRGTPFYYGRGPGQENALVLFSVEDRETTELATGIRGFAVSPDGSKILTREGAGFRLYDADAGAAGKGEPLALGNFEVDVVPADEWGQLFDEVWRRFRDWFYVPNMHGYDWEALRAQYQPLLEHVGHRSDLNYLIGEMISELNVSHAYIAGGDFEIPDRPDVALLGAELELDADAGRYRVVRILPAQNEEPKYRSPLRAIGVDVAEGDYLLAIDGQELTADENPYRLLRHRADQAVTLTVSDRPRREGARQVVIDPIDTETELRYLEWVLENYRTVQEATDGRVGYLHLPDMGANGIYEFIKWFYPQVRKEGLIIDVRGNGGGNVSEMLINRLNRELLALGYARTDERPSTYPDIVFTGPMVTLLNETSASDGDIFPAMFKAAGLGPLIGMRSWGGVIGITSRGPLIDGGTVNVPEFGFAGPGGEWIIEGYGVEPDIVVQNDPISLFEGRDPQLQRAIQEVQRLMEEQPARLRERAPPPVKTPGG